MSLEDLIERFCSHCVTQRDQTGNTEAAVNTGCSRCSQCSHSKNILHEFIAKCCHGLAATPQQVLDNLLSVEDQQDIINGDIPNECLRAHIKAWLIQGMPHYATRQSNT
jgi:hypothetical protein